MERMSGVIIKNRIITLLVFICMPLVAYPQNESAQDLEAYFSALIVSDFESSINWYSEILGFEVVSSAENAEKGFKQSNLRRGDILIELIELDKAVNIEEVVPNYDNKIRVIGIFKIGFMVTDFDKWIDHLTKEKVDFYGSIVNDQITGKRMVIINDPDGNRIQIFEK